MADNTEDAGGAATQQDATPQQITLQKLYIKDLSFEAPNSPELFRDVPDKDRKTEPQIEMNLKNRHMRLDGDDYEVALIVNVHAKLEDRTLYVLEVDQAAIFTIKGYEHDDFMHLIGSYCPSTLFPYVREVVSTIIGQGGFPRVLLQPISFDALYSRSKEETKLKGTTE